MQVSEPRDQTEYIAQLRSIDELILGVQKSTRDLSNNLKGAIRELDQAKYQWSAAHPVQTHLQALREVADTQRRVQSGELPNAEPEYHPMSILDAMGHGARQGGADQFARSMVRNPRNLPPGVRSSKIQQPRSVEVSPPPMMAPQGKVIVE